MDRKMEEFLESREEILTWMNASRLFLSHNTGFYPI